MKRILLFITIIAVTALAYLYWQQNSIDINKLRESRWKYSGGYYIKDFPAFNSKKFEYCVVDDTIYYCGEDNKCNLKMGVVKKVNSHGMMIESFDGKKGHYTFFETVKK